MLCLYHDDQKVANVVGLVVNGARIPDADFREVERLVLNGE